MTRALLFLLEPWNAGFAGAVLFFSGLALGLLFCTGGCRV